MDGMILRTHLVSHTLGYDIRSGYLGHEHRITKMSLRQKERILYLKHRIINTV